MDACAEWLALVPFMLLLSLVMTGLFVTFRFLVSVDLVPPALHTPELVLGKVSTEFTAVAVHCITVS